MTDFQKFNGVIDYKKITNRCFCIEIDLADLITVLQARNIFVTMDYYFFVFSGYSRSLTISPFFPKFRQMPTLSPML